MMGVGVGFDTKGSLLHKYKINMPDQNTIKTFVINDTREGWVDSLRLLLASYLKPNHEKMAFDYS